MADNENTRAPALDPDRAYDKIDRFLRSNLDDADYAEFSAALDAMFGACAPAAAPLPTQRIEELAHRKAHRYLHGSANPNDNSRAHYVFDRHTLLDFAAAILATPTGEAADERTRAPDAPPWQERVMRDFDRKAGADAERDRIIGIIRARHESGWSCEPWELVKAIRAASPSGERTSAPGEQR